MKLYEYKRLLKMLSKLDENTKKTIYNMVEREYNKVMAQQQNTQQNTNENWTYTLLCNSCREIKLFKYNKLLNENGLKDVWVCGCGKKDFNIIQIKKD